MIVDRPTKSATMSAGSIVSSPNTCEHDIKEIDAIVAVIGAGKMGLPMCAQYAHHGWKVIAVDNNPDVVMSINAGKSHIGSEPFVSDLIASAVLTNRLSATDSIVDAVSQALVVVVIIPVGLNEENLTDFLVMDGVVNQIGLGLQPGATVIFETTVPVGTTRERYTPILEVESGLVAGKEFFVAFSPERVSSGSVLDTLATYPKLVGGINSDSTHIAASFYNLVLDAEIVAMSSCEAAEFAKLMDTTYRDVNIALANEFAEIADDLSLDVQEVISAANSQPYSNVHQPGIGVGGHCIPVYPRLLMQSTMADTRLIHTARIANMLRPGYAAMDVCQALGEPQDLVVYTVLILGVTYRHGVKELAFSPGIDIISSFKALGATVYAWDPLLTEDEVRDLGVEAWKWGDTLNVQAIVSTTADPVFSKLHSDWFTHLEIFYDGRNSLRDLELPEWVEYIGVGVQNEMR